MRACCRYACGLRPVAASQQNLGGQVGAIVPGETLDQAQDQVQERSRPARGDHVAVINDHPVGCYVHRRVASAQFVSEHPMGGGRPSIEQAGVGDQEGTSARSSRALGRCLPGHVGTGPTARRPQVVSAATTCLEPTTSDGHEDVSSRLLSWTWPIGTIWERWPYGTHRSVTLLQERR